LDVLKAVAISSLLAALSRQLQRWRQKLLFWAGLAACPPISRKADKRVRRAEAAMAAPPRVWGSSRLHRSEWW